jgi:hypothetical protein
LKNQKLIFIFLLVLTAVSLNYYFANFLPGAFKAFRMGVLAVVVIIGLGYSFQKGKGFVVPVQLMILGMILSILVSYLSRGQDMSLGFLATLPFLAWPVFFLLLKLKVPVEMIEKVVIYFGLIYIVCYFFQFANPGKVLFSLGSGVEEFRETRGIIRIIFPGAGAIWLFTGLALTRFTSVDDLYKPFWFIILILCIIMPFMQATRTYIAPTILIYCYHFAKTLSLSKKVIIGFALVFAALSVSDLEIPVIQGILEQSEQQSEEGSKDIRVVAATYFLTEFSPSSINKILGNGMGHERSDYGQLMKQLAEKGLFIPDIGIFGIYAYFGILPIIGWCLIGYKVYTYRLPPKYIYLKYYFFYIYFGAITGGTFYHIHYMITTIFALYIFQIVVFDKKRILLDKLKQLDKSQLRLLKKLIDYSKSTPKLQQTLIKDEEKFD